MKLSDPAKIEIVKALPLPSQLGRLRDLLTAHHPEPVSSRKIKVWVWGYCLITMNSLWTCINRLNKEIAPLGLKVRAKPGQCSPGYRIVEVRQCPQRLNTFS
tara:strand:- start:919 stop:1224 length:306 start_codon:yes stop_codon:yes gene_type:complete